MKLPLLEELKTRKFPQESMPRHHRLINMDQEVGKDIALNHKYRTTVEIGYSQIVPPGQPIDIIHKLGTEAIMYEVYGPIVDELLKLTKELYEMGLSTEDKPVKHVWDMITHLQGRK